MPKELRTSEQFQQMLPKAIELRVVRNKDSVKLKIRTPDYLYTFKTNADEAEDLIKGAKDVEVIEVTPETEEKEEKTKESKESEESD